LVAEPLLVEVEGDDCNVTPVTVRWCSNRDDKSELLELRYRAYLDGGFIGPSREQIFADAYDDLSTTLTAGLFKAGRCIATLRLCFAEGAKERDNLPCGDVYPEISSLKDTGTIVELCRLALDPAIDNTRYRARLYAAIVHSISECSGSRRQRRHGPIRRAKTL
jgi:hypothetical protein